MRPKPAWRLLAALYPFAAGAAAVNLYFASLIASWSGWQVLTPHEAVVWGLLTGLPASWAFGRHIARLMHEAERREV
ncbi:NnrT protein [Defluviimonas salinarum]|uniref:NnrT protein n=1 Tax=Defluviimonas salinarum TaxID=2992147 RepID=A0ABT3J9P1_9RHOB|nr:NnrT protein [Defluviimonas salinarum]MCW3784407.1 NnrT protein [Defluviimonas salinarum]